MPTHPMLPNLEQDADEAEALAAAGRIAAGFLLVVHGQRRAQATGAEGPALARGYQAVMDDYSVRHHM
jgi:hypothetical protein